MAICVKLTGIPRDDGSPVWAVEPGWWNGGELLDDPRFHAAPMTAGYLDAIAMLTPEETLELNARFREHAMSWQLEHSSKLDDHCLRGPEETLFVSVWVFEWESGLGP